MPIRWPSPSVFSGTLVGEDVAKLRGEHHAASQRRGDAQRERTAAANGVFAATQRDASEYAEAMRLGKPDPGPRNVEQNRQTEADAARRVAGEVATLRSIERDVDALRVERREPWLADIAERRATALTAARESFEAARESIAEVMQLDVARLWVRTGQPNASQPRVPGANALPLPVVVNALGSMLAEWQPSAPQPDVATIIEDDEGDA